MLDQNAMTELKAWLGTLSPPSSVKSNQEAMDRELGLLVQTLKRGGADTPDRIRKTFEELKRTSETRAWPTARDLLEAISKLRSRSSDERDGIKRRQDLTYDERQLLETKILPTARDWLSEPSLRQHAEKTLEYWGEAY